MKQNIYLAGFTILLVFLIKFEAKTQDVHYSQFYNSPLNINPALTGIFNGDVRVIGSLRDQWRPVPVPYTTFTGSYDMKYLPKKSNNSFFGLGAFLNYDRAGDGKYNITDLNLTGSYTYIINKENLLTGGLLLGIASEGFTPGGLTWANQWDGLSFNENLGNGESFDRTNRLTYLETGIGGNYRYQRDSSRTTLDAGVAFFHFNQPSTQFLNVGTAKLPLRTALNAVANIQLTNTFDIQLHGIAQFQSTYSEYVFGGLAKLHVNQQRGKEFRIDAGLSYRTFGYLIPKLAFQYRGYYLGLSYDVNLSPFRDDFGANGGPEVHFRYIISKVKPLSGGNKPCPVY